jgi:hypothetical protein
MRIAFVCAGAEPGGDGVGDYTRRMAEELRGRGHTAAILALNDRSLGAGLERGDNELRLSQVTPWSVRMREARFFLEEFRPDVLSLQFVGYGFDPRGLPLGLASKLRTLAAGVPWHIMFHELWIEPEGTWTHRALSRLQQAHIVDLCRTLGPMTVNTSNSYYAARLESAGIPCRELPLFGNIPVVPHESPRNEDEWVFVFFGSLRRGWEPEPLLTKINSARAAAGKKICRFVSIGRLGEHGESVWEKMKGGGYENFVFEKRGELDPPGISRSLQECDFGIAVSPLHLLGKSGAVAAMHEHGLPVIVNRSTSPKAQEGPASTLRSGCPPGPNIRPSIEADALTRGFCQDRGGSRKHTDAALTSRALLAQRFTSWIVLLDENFEKNLTTAKRTNCQEMIGSVTDQFLFELEGTDRPPLTPAA